MLVISDVVPQHTNGQHGLEIHKDKTTKDSRNKKKRRDAYGRMDGQKNEPDSREAKRGGQKMSPTLSTQYRQVKFDW